LGWGLYNTFKWSVIAKLCGAKVFFVSVGAGPFRSRAGRRLVKAALSAADFRSYRDESSLQQVKAIGVQTSGDRVCPDLAFSLPESVIPRYCAETGRRPVVGLGLMCDTEIFKNRKPTGRMHAAYLETLAEFVRWLLAREYDVRLLIGDTGDASLTQEFRSLLRSRRIIVDETRVVDALATSVEDFLPQLAATDIVVATRFHNVLLALLLNKPAISISFHDKCASLMSQMGLSEYCEDINDLKVEKLIQKFCHLEKNAESLRPVIRQKTEEFRKALDEQYRLIFKDLLPG
jgi:polysaccharide pyruvyl transferase WcaK-like protein